MKLFIDLKKHFMYIIGNLDYRKNVLFVCFLTKMSTRHQILYEIFQAKL